MNADNQKGLAPLIIITLIVLGLSSFVGGAYLRKALEGKSLATPREGYFSTGSLDKGNFIYGGAMQLAVNELNESVLHEKLKLVLDLIKDKETVRMLGVFNSAGFTKNDLDEPSFYIKSGYGQDTVAAINKESRVKFPDKSFSDLDLKLGPQDIISYAYFLKKVEYLVQFKEGPFTFKGEQVKGFSADSSQQKSNVLLVDYIDDNKFIIKLKLKDDSDEMYLAKGYDQVDSAITLILNKGELTAPISSDDVFGAPNIHLDYHRDYEGFTDKVLANKAFTNPPYKIVQMFEDIKFDMDYKGARVENQATIWGDTFGALKEIPQIKKLILDKPYLVIMKRSLSTNPYFILGVNNSNILEK